MTKIYYVRHGQNEDNAAGLLNGHRDLPLTDLGREQAMVAAGLLKGKKIDVVYASPLSRAMETAEVIVRELGLDEAILDDDLMERDFGILTGKPKTDISKYCSQVIEVGEKQFFLDGEGVETYPDLYRRAESFVGKIKDLYPDETVLVVAHGDIGKIIRAVWNGWGWRRGVEAENIDNASVLELG